MSAGYIGLGTMGEPMAACVVRSGQPTTVFDLRREPIDRLVDLGAHAASSVAEVGERSQVVLINVVDDAQLATVVLGADAVPGLIATMQPGSTVIVQSTVDPDSCRRHAKRLARRGIGLIDAPFTGGLAAANQGRLAILVGGSPQDVERCTQVLSAMGTIVHVGDVGAGELAKLANNLAIAITMQAVSEALTLASSVGIDDLLMLSILSAGAAQSWVSDSWPAIAEMTRTYPAGAAGLANLTYKDLALALAVAHDRAIALPATALAAQRLREPYERALQSGPERFEPSIPATEGTT